MAKSRKIKSRMVRISGRKNRKSFRRNIKKSGGDSADEINRANDKKNKEIQIEKEEARLVKEMDKINR